MGSHGGLNILPQKRWNVYNYENQEKVWRNKEATAKEEQLKREQFQKRDTEFNLEKLHQAHRLESRGPDQLDDQPSSSTAKPEPIPEPSKSESDPKHINLFEGIKIFDPTNSGDGKEDEKEKNKKVKKEAVRTVGREDEVYRLGYGLAEKEVKLSWYMEKRVADEKHIDKDDDEDEELKEKRKSGGKKTLEESREERLKREKKEKEGERDLLMLKSKKDGGFSSRRRGNYVQ
ncbi:hypothetical protein PHJA_002261100 [Phtheirospermum japonicum]|uniref:CBF1-interacting co-repressor CIR N-terminal domain-containing protein n=1 Tax=Phtheirospermum japonicum TaxID=374723 RepID=A0A830D439_9LAMI|nr:hypothetical protein PHJA_002261100 [Phtheirospermum japonicum]